MKRTIIASLIAFGLTLSSIAQTNLILSTNEIITLPLIQVSGLSSNNQVVANDVAQIISGFWPYLTNHNVTLGVAPLYGQNHFGELASLLVPIQSNSLVSVGIGEAYADTNLFIAPLSAKIGSNFKIPVINRNVYLFAEEGLDLKCTSKLSLGSQTCIGAITWWDINKHLQLNAEGGYVKFSQLNGNDWFFGFSFTYHPAKW